MNEVHNTINEMKLYTLPFLARAGWLGYNSVKSISRLINEGQLKCVIRSITKNGKKMIVVKGSEIADFYKKNR